MAYAAASHPQEQFNRTQPLARDGLPSVSSPASADASPELSPLLRELVSRSRASSRPASAAALTSTQELKLATCQRDIKEHRRQLSQRSAQQLSPDGSDELNNAASPSAADFQRDLGPLYPRFQQAAQAAQAGLANGFPGAVRTAFERTSYWKRAPPTQSNQLGTLAWLFLHYALPSPADVPSVSTLSELESDSLRLSFRGLLFMCTDWKVVPQLTSKARMAELYHRFGGVTSTTSGRARVDVGLTYAAFVRCIACVALETRLPAAPSLSASKSAPLTALNATPRDRVMAFLNATRWNQIEVVASGLEKLGGSAWYRLRMELPQAKSVYIHKPTCLFRHKEMHHTGSRTNESVQFTRLKACPCQHASAPNWAPLTEQLVKGVQDRPSVLHLDPHNHARHSMAAVAKQKPGQGASPAPAQRRPATSSGVRTLPTTISSAAASGELTADESRAYKTLRIFDRLPLESTWCSYPGAYIDMGVVEVLPALAPGARAPVSSPSKRDPSEIVPSALRPHKYTLSLQNRAAAGLKVSISSEGCEWLSLQYKAQNFLSLGMNQRLAIQAPTHMPHDATPTGERASGSAVRDQQQQQRQRAPGLGQGVERLGHIILRVENSWTYAVSQLSVPVYARLVLKGSSHRLTSLPTFQPSPSVPALLLPADAHAETHQQHQHQQHQQQQFAVEVRDEDADDDIDDADE